MNDQAASLRKLKQMVDKAQPQKESIEDFLKSIVRPSPFCSVAIVVPDAIIRNINNVKNWMSSVMDSSPRACFWDQAQLIDLDEVSNIPFSGKYPTTVKIESAFAPLNILPFQKEHDEIAKMNTVNKISYLRHLIRNLQQFTEVWISIKASQLLKYYPVLHATDSLCLIVPNHLDSILGCYETVKSIHLSGYFSPLGLLDYSDSEHISPERSSGRIKTVAKQFLALDLVDAGVVLSNDRWFPPESQNSLRARLSAIERDSRDFLYFMSESILYQIPGLY